MKATLIVVFASLLAGSALAQEENGKRKTVKVYDVRELIHTIPNYPYAGGLSTRDNPAFTPPRAGGESGGGGGLFGGGTNAAASAAQADAAVELIKLIEDTVVPQSWKDNGGDQGHIKLLNGNLVVTQTADGHKQVEELLHQLRDQQGRLVRVRADWVLVDPAQATALLADKGAGDAVLPEVDPAALAQLPADAAHYHGEIAGFSGQTIHIVAGRFKNVVTDLDPIVAQDSVGFDPVECILESGAVLQATPSVQSDGKTATLDVHSVLTEAGITGPINMQGIATVATTRPGAALTAGADMDRY
ncbi:MAG: hypothetical protein ACREJC_02930, partial [Tepidisphaeraceae bacterium]